jgi:putative redox protein
MEAKVTWKGKMSFEGTADSGFTLPIGTRLDYGGDSDGFSPMELILVGLAGCTGMDVASILQKKRQDITEFEIRVLAERALDHPRVFTTICLEFVVVGNNVDPIAVERAVQLSETKYCSAQAMLGQVVKISHKITILEAEAP